MAKPSRQQRRDRRAQQPALAGAGAPPAPPARQTARGGDEPERRPRQSTERERPGGGPIRFVQESYGELRKVEWPSQTAVISGTVVEPLMTRGYDEPFTLYGLLARTVETDAARSYVTFTLDPAAFERAHYIRVLHSWKG